MNEHVLYVRLLSTTDRPIFGQDIRHRRKQPSLSATFNNSGLDLHNLQLTSQSDIHHIFERELMRLFTVRVIPRTFHLFINCGPTEQTALAQLNKPDASSAKQRIARERETDESGAANTHTHTVLRVSVQAVGEDERPISQ